MRFATVNPGSAVVVSEPGTLHPLPVSVDELVRLGLARALGYADEISNTVVDALGDLSGGVRLQKERSE